MADELADGIAKLAIKAPSKADFPAFGLNRETAVGMVPGIGEAATKALENLSDSKRELKIPQITTAAQLIGLFLLLGEENFKPVSA